MLELHRPQSMTTSSKISSLHLRQWTVPHSSKSLSEINDVKRLAVHHELTCEKLYNERICCIRTYYPEKTKRLLSIKQLNAK